MIKILQGAVKQTVLHKISKYDARST